MEPGAYPTDVFANGTGPDDAARAAEYGELAGYAGQLAAGMTASAQGRNPQEVADAIVRLANAPAGTRALRTVVPENPAVDAINAATAPIQREVIKSFGFESLLPKTAV